MKNIGKVYILRTIDRCPRTVKFKVIHDLLLRSPASNLVENVPQNELLNPITD